MGGRRGVAEKIGGGGGGGGRIHLCVMRRREGEMGN